MTSFKNSKGFSLIELIVAGAVLSALAMGSMTLMKNMLSESKYIESLGEADHFVNRLRFYFLDKDACYNTLNSYTIPSNSTTPILISSIKDKENKVIFNLAATNTVDAAVKVQPLIRLNKIELFNSDNIPPNGYGQVELRVFMLRNQKTATGAEDVMRKLHVAIGTDSAMKVTKCFSSTENAIESAYKLVCLDFGGEYDASTGTCNFFPLVNGQHNLKQCEDIGGVVTDVGTGKVCKISAGATVPKSWDAYDYWSSTASTTPTDADCNSKDATVTAGNIMDIYNNPSQFQSFPSAVSNLGTCPTSSHSWSNTPVETCNFVCTETGACPTGTCRTLNRTLKAQTTERGYY